MNKRVPLLAGIALLSFAHGMGLFEGWFSTSTAGQKTARLSGSFSDPAANELHALLYDLKRSWHPRDRASSLARAKVRFPALETTLLRMLEHPQDRLIPQAIQLAAEARVQRSRSRLLELAKIQEYRAEAIKAAAALKPFPIEAVRNFLEEANPEVLVAALGLTKKLEAGSLAAQVLRLLGHEKEAVRQAASAAVPKSIPESERAELLRLAEYGDSRVRCAAIKALGRSGIDEKVEDTLVKLLAERDKPIRLATIRALSTKTEPLSSVDKLYALIDDSESDFELGVACYALIEKTHSASIETLVDRLAVAHPIYQYSLARCLIQAGEKRGVEALIELIAQGQDAFYGVPERWSKEVLSMSRTLVELMSGIPYYTGLEAWERWCDDLPRELEAEMRVQLLKVAAELSSVQS